MKSNQTHQILFHFPLFLFIIIISQIVYSHECNPGEYEENGNCYPCTSNLHCATCTDNKSCTSCQNDGHILDAVTGHCIYPCDEGRFYDISIDQCSPCPLDNCGVCDSVSNEHTCLKCKALYVFNETKACVPRNFGGGIDIKRIDRTKKRYKKPYIAFLILSLIFFCAFLVLLIVYLSVKVGGNDEDEVRPVAVDDKPTKK